jgi:hypothetical protein
VPDLPRGQSQGGPPKEGGRGRTLKIRARARAGQPAGSPGAHGNLNLTRAGWVGSGKCPPGLDGPAGLGW